MSGELAFVSCTVNGVAREFHVRAEEMLIDVLGTGWRSRAQSSPAILVRAAPVRF